MSREQPRLPGFEKLNRFHDRESGLVMIKLLPGEYYVTCQPEIITTVLGSCVSACVRDKRRGIAGMNHFMLPGTYSHDDPLSQSARFGNWAMEVMLNTMFKAGAQREDLEFKIFGGARVIAHMEQTDIGRKNVEFMVDYARLEQFDILAQDTGNIYPRKIQFYTETGKVRVKRLEMLRNTTVLEREQRYQRQLQIQDNDSVELFGEG